MTGTAPARPGILAVLAPGTGSDVEPPTYALARQGEAEDGTRRVTVPLAKLVPDTGSDVEPPTYTLACQGEAADGTRCVTVPVELNDLAQVQGWAFVHMMRHPGHRSYRMVADVPVVVVVPETEPE
ncbi:hypothetical protein ACFY00_01070 [Kitasatospora sp. NPDC001540]|uniref:DUF7848 domain-containing protein n=1 Tax=Kitasatospora sp. NPDC001540 TaxID=3364014 RepID=UPI00368F90C9